jgi:hypothetical protein
VEAGHMVCYLDVGKGTSAMQVVEAGEAKE